MRRAVDASIVDARAAHARSADARGASSIFDRHLSLWRRRRHVRWVAAAIAVPALWACSSHRLSIPEANTAIIDQRTFAQTVNHKLDVLFMVDDSSSMAALQKKMSDQLGTFMDILVDPSTGLLPDMHVAVVSSSFGAGAFEGVSQCPHDLKYPGNDGAKFLQGPGGPGAGRCTMLHRGAQFLDTGDGVKTHPNYDGDVRDAFRCIALIGEGGCGFESQFESVYYALAREASTGPDNTGFLREDAVLAVVMLTNEDDCSVPSNSALLNPGIISVSDPSGMGALRNYRCNEFGHLCKGSPPPHGYPDPIPPGGVTLQDCVSAEDKSPKTDDAGGFLDESHGHLFTVNDMTDLFGQLKPTHPGDILVAAIAGPPTPYRVLLETNPYKTDEAIPMIDHSCTYPTDDKDNPEYADPAVRINQWVHTFGANGLFYPICAPELKNAMTGIANKIHQKLGASCISTNVAWKNPDNHDDGHNCQVSRKVVDVDTKEPTATNVDECRPVVTNMNAPERPMKTPCYQLIPNATNDCRQADAQTFFRICDKDDCKPAATSNERQEATVTCLVQ